MHAVVLGAGVIGVTTAWYLRRAGYEVTVVERHCGAAEETSYANGGQISVSHAEPWANPGTPLKMLRWLPRRDAPLLFRPRADLNQWLWGLDFLGQCTRRRARRNLGSIVSLGLYSRQKLWDLREETGINYEQRCEGILHFYTSDAVFQQAQGPARAMRELGCERRVIRPDEALRLEPALASIEDRMAGATYTAQDESGNAWLFTRRLAQECERIGVRFRYNTEVLSLEREQDRLSGVRVIENGRHTRVEGDTYVLSLGSYSAMLARPLGVKLRMYPAKGYSITAPVRDESRAYTVSLIDDEYKIVYSRLGDRLRVAGTAELSGYSRDLDLERCRAIVRRAAECFPGGADWDAAEFWAGLRPTTPSNVPYIGATAIPNLYLNTGHGTLGWTHACGSAAALTDLMRGQVPDVDFPFARP